MTAEIRSAEFLCSFNSKSTIDLPRDVSCPKEFLVQSERCSNFLFDPRVVELPPVFGGGYREMNPNLTAPHVPKMDLRTDAAVIF